MLCSNTQQNNLLLSSFSWVLNLTVWWPSAETKLTYVKGYRNYFPGSGASSLALHWFWRYLIVLWFLARLLLWPCCRALTSQSCRLSYSHRCIFCAGHAISWCPMYTCVVTGWLAEPHPGNTSVLPVSVWLFALMSRLFSHVISFYLSVYCFSTVKTANGKHWRW